MKVIIRGTGQLNGTVNIYKELELDESIARSILGSKKNEILTSLINTHYPGVKFNPNQIGVNVVSNNEEEKSIKNDFLKGAVVGALAGATVSKKSKNKNTSPIVGKSFRDEIVHLLDLDFNDDKNQIESTLDKIYITLKSYKWSLLPLNSEREKANGLIMNQVFEKYKIGYRKLKKVNSNLDEIKPHIKQFKRLRFRKIFGQFSLYLLIGLFFMIIFLFS